MIRVGIFGATGYTGLELLRFLSNHSKVKVTVVTSKQFAGKKISDLFPGFKNYEYLTLVSPDSETIISEADLFFTALPHQVSMDIVPKLLEEKKKVIDLSADFRLKDVSIYEAWYGEHKAKEIIQKAVYGLPEIYENEIKKTDLVANPGCYPTTAILALAPFLKEKLIDINSIIIDAKSGVSGAGRSPKLTTHFCEANEDMKAYNVCIHRHTPEIEQELSFIAGREVKVTFVPHLIPASRGMFTTIYAHLTESITTEDAYKLIKNFYLERYFIKVLVPPNVPQTIYVRGTNECHLGVKVNERTKKIVIMAAIDNLGKGASGQAIQNMNIMLNLPEETGLKIPPLFP
ncbi:MAG: N-acetyl-gamma-glutamyl-phosphate reductase [Candidatus Desulfofervidus auxilii]|nr:N-acetyl-gamma-glutamyl-phosphate reductase [Candidatus Desulfofervidus auxilii]